MKKTFKQIQEIDNLVGVMYAKQPELKDSKFGYAYNKFFEKNYAPTLKVLKEELTDSTVDHALEDETTKALLKDEKGEYKYSKEGQKALMKAQREIYEKYNNLEIEVEPYISTFTPNLTEEEREMLEGTLIETKKK